MSDSESSDGELYHPKLGYPGHNSNMEWNLVPSTSYLLYGNTNALKDVIRIVVRQMESSVTIPLRPPFNYQTVE